MRYTIDVPDPTADETQIIERVFNKLEHPDNVDLLRHVESGMIAFGDLSKIIHFAPYSLKLRVWSIILTIYNKERKKQVKQGAL